MNSYPEKMRGSLSKQESRGTRAGRTGCAHSVCPAHVGTAVPAAAPVGITEARQGWKRKVLRQEADYKLGGRKGKGPSHSHDIKTPFCLYSDFQKQKSSQEVEGDTRRRML